MASVETQPKQKKMFSRIYPETPDDEIVISGISGRFPSSSNLHEFAYNLYNKIDMVDDDGRWIKNTYSAGFIMHLKFQREDGSIPILKFQDVSFTIKIY